MRFKISPLAGQESFGAVVTDLAPEAIEDPATRQALYDLWIDRGVIVFRGLEGAETQLRLSEIFGEMQDHPLTRSMGIKVDDTRLSDIRYDPVAAWMKPAWPNPAGTLALSTVGT